MSGARDGAAGGSSGAAEAGEASRGLVLLVDDEPTIARGYARILTAAGFTVEIAHDGAEAADHTRQKTFDAIVSDIAMPQMSGLALLKTIREHDLDVPVILMTG
ncbi:MAG TPA: response regulator, partial [Polyangia bacterium]|nr:response regulator [Polyangia bacterium]